MDFSLPEELLLLQQRVRKFVQEELIPIEMQSLDGTDLKPEIRARLEEKTKKMGLWMLDVPQEYGGAGLDFLAQVLVWEEISKTVALPFRGQGIFGPEVRPILFQCTDKQKERYLYPVLRGEKRMCFAQTEPDAGSDPGSMKTRAVRHGDVYVLNGVKRVISNADKCHFAQVLAVTDPARGCRHAA